jgi:hypothetical protein
VTAGEGVATERMLAGSTAAHAPDTSAAARCPVEPIARWRNHLPAVEDEEFPMQDWIVGVIAGLQVLSLAVPAAQAQDADFRCRQTIAKEFAKFVKTTTGVVRKCNDTAVRSGAAASAPGGDINACDTAAKVSAGLPRMAGKIDAKCDGEGISPSDIQWPATCPDIEGGSCGAAIGDGNDIADCLDCAGRSAVAQSMDLSYLDLADPAGDGDVVKCQRAIGR